MQAAKSVFERTPPELSADIIDRGVILTGGGALLHGIDMLLAEELKVPVLVAESQWIVWQSEPASCLIIWINCHGTNSTKKRVEIRIIR